MQVETLIREDRKEMTQDIKSTFSEKKKRRFLNKYCNPDMLVKVKKWLELDLQRKAQVIFRLLLNINYDDERAISIGSLIIRVLFNLLDTNKTKQIGFYTKIIFCFYEFKIRAASFNF